MHYVIFTIDMQNNPFRMNVFMNYLAVMQEASRGKVLPMLGKYKGEPEHSFICRLDDFDTYLRGTEYLKGQESILHVAQGNKMECWLEYLADGRTETLGHMHQVCREEAMQADNYTYSPALKAYWIAKPGNPDGSYRRSVAQFRAPVADEQPQVRLSDDVSGDSRFDDYPVFDRTRFGERNPFPNMSDVGMVGF